MLVQELVSIGISVQHRVLSLSQRCACRKSKVLVLSPVVSSLVKQHNFQALLCVSQVK